MWLLFACLAGLLYTVQGLMTRHVLRGQKDAWAFSFYFSLIGALVSMPFLLTGVKVPFSWQPWALALLVGLLIVGQNFFNFKSTNFIEASISGAITKFRLVWIFILSLVILGEGFSWLKLFGTLLTVGAGLVIIQRIKRPKSSLGVLLAFSATIFYAVIIILYKYLLVSFNSVSLTFFVTFLPAVVINLVLMPRAFTRVKKMFQENGLLVFIACVFGALANLALNQGLAMGEATKVLVIIEAFLVLTLVGEHFFLKEKEYAWVKIAAVLFATLGAILIRLS
ncbi:MAG TPA: DMT family transporter [Candidatus Saccharimonadales bacterium]|nr:DMT family transporter [Candidatus Saccharimonadales bacterium]